MQLPQKYIDQIKAPISLQKEISPGGLFKKLVEAENAAEYVKDLGAQREIESLEAINLAELQRIFDKGEERSKEYLAAATEVQKQIQKIALSIVAKAKTLEIPLQDVLCEIAAFPLPDNLSGETREMAKFGFQQDKMDERAKEVAQRISVEEPELFSQLHREALKKGADATKNILLAVSHYISDQLPDLLDMEYGEEEFVPRSSLNKEE